MGFAFKRFTSSNYQEIVDKQASFEAKVQHLETYGTIQSIVTYDPVTRTKTDSIAYLDPNNGNTLVIKDAISRAPKNLSEIESVSGLSSGAIAGWLDTNYGSPVSGGGGGGPVFERYRVYRYMDPKEACRSGEFGAPPITVYFYRDQFFSDSRGETYFDGRDYWYYATDESGNFNGSVWSIDSRGSITTTFVCEF